MPANWHVAPCAVKLGDFQVKKPHTFTGQLKNQINILSNYCACNSNDNQKGPCSKTD